MPCHKRPLTARADGRRRHLLETARALFMERGFHGTGVAQIAERSSIAVGQIYRDFAGKEDIIAAICEADTIAWLEEPVLAEAVADGDTEAIRTWIKRFCCADGCVDDVRLMSEITAEAGRNERVAAVQRAIDDRVRTNLVAALRALVRRADREEEVARLADFVLTIGIGIVTWRAVHPDFAVGSLSQFVGSIVDQELERLAR